MHAYRIQNTSRVLMYMHVHTQYVHMHTRAVRFCYSYDCGIQHIMIMITITMLLFYQLIYTHVFV